MKLEEALSARINVEAKVDANVEANAEANVVVAANVAVLPLEDEVVSKISPMKN